MGRFKQNNKFLDYIFSNEKKMADSTIGSPERWLKVIIETYKAAKEEKLQIAEVASRRFRKKEFYIYTCITMGISPAKYYRLLSIFFKIAEKKIEKIFSNSEK